LRSRDTREQHEPKEKSHAEQCSLFPLSIVGCSAVLNNPMSDNPNGYMDGYPFFKQAAWLYLLMPK
jgi:hypothetical protein